MNPLDRALYGGIKMDFKKVQQYSLKTSLAMANFSHSVIHVYPNSIGKINSKDDCYIGVKQAPLISASFLSYLDQNGFHLHTVDKASHKGRGIDIDLKNPITGRFMTGSSSGTALNVFYGINDIGVGTDGGGSVLSPAAALNLIGFIHPKFGERWIDFQKYTKTSTDNISFAPSIGFISRNLELIKRVSRLFLGGSFKKNDLKVAIDSEIDQEKWFGLENSMTAVSKDFNYKYGISRQELIGSLEELLSEFDILVSKEGPIDVHGVGETLFGHYDEWTKETQIKGKKGFVRVVNMCNAAGLIVPSTEFATGYLIIAKAQNGLEKRMFDLAEMLIANEDSLVDNYFLDHKSYFDEGYTL